MWRASSTTLIVAAMLWLSPSGLFAEAFVLADNRSVHSNADFVLGDDFIKWQDSRPTDVLSVGGLFVENVDRSDGFFLPNGVAGGGSTAEQLSEWTGFAADSFSARGMAETSASRSTPHNVLGGATAESGSTFEVEFTFSTPHIYEALGTLVASYPNGGGDGVGFAEASLVIARNGIEVVNIAARLDAPSANLAVVDLFHETNSAGILMPGTYTLTIAALTAVDTPLAMDTFGSGSTSAEYDIDLVLFETTLPEPASLAIVLVAASTTLARRRR